MDTKELLKSNELTNPIGIIDQDGFEQNNRVYWWGGYSPTILARCFKDPVRVLVYEREEIGES